MGQAAKHSRPHRREADSRDPGINEEPPGRLRFETGDERGGRVGDRKARAPDDFPPERGREAGMTGGSMPGDGPTADDMTPETLLDSEPSHTPHDRSGRTPSDSALNVRMGNRIGAGGGLDEAEEADVHPIGTPEAKKLERKARRHAADPNAFEPHEAAERFEAAQPDRRGGDAPGGGAPRG